MDGEIYRWTEGRGGGLQIREDRKRVGLKERPRREEKGTRLRRDRRVLDGGEGGLVGWRASHGILV